MNALTAIKSGIRVATSFVITNKKAILTLAGIGLIGGGAGYMVVQAPKAKDAIITEEHIREKEGKDPLTNIEKVKIGVRYLWVPSAMCTAGTGALLFVNHISVKEVAAAGADALAYKQAYNDLARIHNDYIRGVNKVTTEEQQKEIRNEVGEQRVVSNSSDIVPINTGRGDALFLDELSGQYFRSTEVAVCNAALSFNSDMTNCRLANSYGLEGYGTINEWLEMYLGINPIGMIGDDNGWKVYDGNVFRIHISDRFDTAPNGEPVRVISYECAPMII